MTETWSTASAVRLISLFDLPLPWQYFKIWVGSVLTQVRQALNLSSVVEGWTLVLLIPTASLVISVEVSRNPSPVVIEMTSVSVNLIVFAETGMQR